MAGSGTGREEPGRTRWTRVVRTPVRAFVQAETRGSALLLTATVAALVWANADASSYDGTWTTVLSVRLGSHGLDLTVREWVDSGLMALFFFVVGLEARREADLGELRELRRVALPLLAGLAGMAVPVGTYLAFNAGSASAHGWGVAMSTDTAFALGVLAVVGPTLADRMRAFLLTVLVVDDVVALLVIAFGYREQVAWRPLAVAGGLFAVVLAARTASVRRGLVYGLLGVAIWLAMVDSGVDPLVVGLAMGLLVYAYPAARTDLERATQEFRLFREQPTPELARRARASVESAISPNERLSLLWHPWTSYLIVPVFALANAGVPLGWSFLGQTATSPITLGVFVGYVVGKPVGVTAAAALAVVVSRRRLRPPVGWGAVLGAGSAAGAGFTVSLLIASLAFTGRDLQEAKAGVLAAIAGSAVLSWLVFRVVALLPRPARVRALLGGSAAIVDLVEPVDPDRDHIRGPVDAPVTLVEYGDLECPYCGQAEPVVRALLRDFADVTYVWRHLPLDDVHPHARMAAEATEAAAAQGAFWEMHDLLLSHQHALRVSDLAGYARQLRLDVDAFRDDLEQRRHAARVAADVESADLSGVRGTPTFFVNGRRHHGAFDLASLTAAVEAAGALAASTRPTDRLQADG